MLSCLDCLIFKGNLPFPYPPPGPPERSIPGGDAQRLRIGGHPQIGALTRTEGAAPHQQLHDDAVLGLAGSTSAPAIARGPALQQGRSREPCQAQPADRQEVPACPAAAPSGTQPSGSIYLRTAGATGTRLYVSSGAGTWAAVAGV